MFEFVQMMQRVTLHLTPGSRGQASRQLAAAAYSRFLQISLFSDIRVITETANTASQQPGKTKVKEFSYWPLLPSQ